MIQLRINGSKHGKSSAPCQNVLATLQNHLKHKHLRNKTFSVFHNKLKFCLMAVGPINHHKVHLTWIFQAVWRWEAGEGWDAAGSWRRLVTLFLNMTINGYQVRLSFSCLYCGSVLTLYCWTFQIIYPTVWCLVIFPTVQWHNCQDFRHSFVPCFLSSHYEKCILQYYLVLSYLYLANI